MDERERRIGENEAVFRQVNENLHRLNEAFSAVTNRVELVCECGDLGCVERISVSLDEYEKLRSHADRFLVAAGHVAPGDVEEVVATGGGWDIVRKRPGGPASLAAATDPRR